MTVHWHLVRRDWSIRDTDRFASSSGERAGQPTHGAAWTVEEAADWLIDTAEEAQRASPVASQLLASSGLADPHVRALRLEQRVATLERGGDSFALAGLGSGRIAQLAAYRADSCRSHTPPG